MVEDRPGGEFIVVGVDGSAGSERAMRWAIGEARIRNCAIEAVTAWPLRIRGRMRGSDAAGELQESLIREARCEVDFDPVVSVVVEEGDAEDVLVARAERASLLVVGSHGVDSIRHAALGSTSEYCSRMANCPVVVLPLRLVSASHTDDAVVPMNDAAIDVAT